MNIVKLLLSMGFEEMPTNNYVESSFWNFDALFQPQQHPCRDSHDTFFLSEPKECKDIPEAYKDRVKAFHEKGGQGSIGYRYDWKISEAKKKISYELILLLGQQECYINLHKLNFAL